MDTARDVPPRHSRVFGVGAMRVVVTADDLAFIDRIDHLFSGFPAPSADATTELGIVVKRCTAASGAGFARYDSTVDGESLLSNASLADQEIRITRLLNDRKLDAEPHLLHLHSAAVARGPHAVLLCGRSGSGKSSLTAALVQAGWDYITDEQVVVEPARRFVLPYPRPLTLREPVWALFPHLPRPPEGTGGDEHSRRMETSPLDFGRVSPAARVEPVAVVFPIYAAEPPWVAEGVPTAAEVVQRLASCCYDLERLGHEGFGALVHLAALGRAWDLRFSDLSDAAAHVDDIVTRALDGPPIGVQHTPPVAHPAPPAAGELRRVSDAAAWAFSDGSAVVFGPAALTLSRLDVAGLGAWLALAEPATPGELAQRVGVTTDDSRTSLENWVSAMLAAGLVERG